MKNILPSPKTIIWALCHTLLIVLGFTFFSAGFLHGLLTEPISLSIGASLIAAGIAGIVVYVYVLSSDTLQAQVGLLEEAGLTNIFSRRSVGIRDEYDRRLARAREIDVLGFGQSSLRQDHLSDFVEWSHKANVRVLLIDPDFPSKRYSFASQRDAEEGNAKDSIARDVGSFIEEVSRLKDLNRNKFQIRLARVLPVTNVFRIDNEVFFGPYLMDQASRNAPTFLAREGGYLFQEYKEHFEKIWSSDTYSKAVVLQ